MPADQPAPPRRDLIVLGGSAGSIPVLQSIVRGLPRDFPAALLVVVHQAQSSPGVLPWILSEAGPLPAAHARDGEAIEPGRIYVAPPDRHLLVEPGRLRLSQGPKENRFRPAVDPLFRTAARAYGPRVAGVILSGMLDDGALGLLRIIQHGGAAVVQDPRDATCPDMPANAIRHARVDRVVRADQIADVLTHLTVQPAATLPQGVAAMPPAHDDPTGPDGSDTAARGDDALTSGRSLGAPTGLTCPDCGGAIWEQTEGSLVRFRCHVGHAYTGDSFAAAADAELESALWAAVRMFQENAALHLRLADRTGHGEAVAAGGGGMAARYRERAREAEARAEVVRRLLLGETACSPAPA